MVLNIQSEMNFNHNSWFFFFITLNKHRKQHLYVMSLSLLRQHRQPIWWDSAGTWGPEPGQGWVPKRPLSPLVDSRLAPVEVLD